MPRDALIVTLDELTRLLPNIQEQSLTPSELGRRIKLLQQVFCNPPGGGGGVPTPGKPPPPPDKGGWGRRFQQLGTLANIVRLFLAFHGHHDVAPPPPPELPPELPPWEETVRLIALLALAAFGDELERGREIPIGRENLAPVEEVVGAALATASLGEKRQEGSGSAL